LSIRKIFQHIFEKKKIKSWRILYEKNNNFSAIFFVSLFALSAQSKYSCEDIGKIVLNDGKLITLDSFKAFYEQSDAMAIVWNVADDGSYFYGVGIKTAELPFSKKVYYNCNSGLENLMDGSKALSLIKQNDPDGYKNLEEEYPALYYASIYGKKNRLGKFADGWYVPTIAELDWETILKKYDEKYGKWESVIIPVDINGGEINTTPTRILKTGPSTRGRETWMFFNNQFPMNTWCSNAEIHINSDYYGYFISELPERTKFSANYIKSYYEPGPGGNNTYKANVMVMRKFN